MQKRQKSTLIQEEKKKNNNDKANTKTSQSTKMWNVKKDFLTFQAISLVNWWKALL